MLFRHRVALSASRGLLATGTASRDPTPPIGAALAAGASTRAIVVRRGREGGREGRE